MRSLFKQSIEAEISLRKQLSNLMLDIVLEKFETGYGYSLNNYKKYAARRGYIQDLIFNGLGFHGRPSNVFRRFVNKVMTEAGFRTCCCNGRLIYSGLRRKQS